MAFYPEFLVHEVTVETAPEDFNPDKFVRMIDHKDTCKLCKIF